MQTGGQKRGSLRLSGANEGTAAGMGEGHARGWTVSKRRMRGLRIMQAGNTTTTTATTSQEQPHRHGISTRDARQGDQGDEQVKIPARRFDCTTARCHRLRRGWAPAHRRRSAQDTSLVNVLDETRASTRFLTHTTSSSSSFFPCVLCFGGFVCFSPKPE